MTARHLASLALVIAGCSVIGLAPLAALALRGPLERLHLVTPITSLGAPLVGIGIAVDEGPDLTSGIVLATVALLAISGPVLGIAAARATVPDEKLLSKRREV